MTPLQREALESCVKLYDEGVLFIRILGCDAPDFGHRRRQAVCFGLYVGLYGMEGTWVLGTQESLQYWPFQVLSTG